MCFNHFDSCFIIVCGSFECIEFWMSNSIHPNEFIQQQTAKIWWTNKMNRLANNIFGMELKLLKLFKFWNHLNTKFNSMRESNTMKSLENNTICWEFFGKMSFLVLLPLECFRSHSISKSNYASHCDRSRATCVYIWNRRLTTAFFETSVSAGKEISHQIFFVLAN